MERLPPEIISDILSRLPIESLSQTKYVCKLWNSIVKSPSFAAVHLARRKYKPVVLFHFTNLPHSRDHISNLFLLDPYGSKPHFVRPLRSQLYSPNAQLMVAGSANGILCLLDPDHRDFPIYLCNPLLDQYLTIPPNPEWPPVTKDNCITGFGYDPSTGDYKIVLFLDLPKETDDEDLPEETDDEETEDVPVLEVCTIKPDDNADFVVGPWRKVEMPSYQLKPTAGCLLNGRLHWLAGEDNLFEHIVFFDLYSEEFGIWCIPEITYRRDVRVVVLGRRLCLSHHINFEGLYVRFMKKYGNEESWGREYRITRTSTKSMLDMDTYYPICLMDNKRLLLSTRYKGFLSYDLCNYGIHTYEVVGDSFKATENLATNEIVAHTCSIISLKGVQ